MTMQNHDNSTYNALRINDYEKPTLTIKYFLLESNITFYSNINPADPTGTAENPIGTLPSSWWDDDEEEMN
ncbi:MAG: hypothetical protein IJS94_02460 [Clostridia bacterium]|nr:hypothetical protein [Clostridia bacterium]